MHFSFYHFLLSFLFNQVQLTDFENAAFVAFIVLLTRAILSFHLNLLIPLSKVDENMVTAGRRDAVRQGKFYFRKTLKKCSTTTNGHVHNCGSDCNDFELMTIDKILNGKDGEFPGLIPLIERYLSNVDVDVDTHCTISRYLELISRRASGELLTTAQWIRRFVDQHPDYKKDSVISETISYDLLNTFDRISRGEVGAPKLFGKPTSKTSQVTFC